ncbi:MAG TPA: hypothetical protein VFX76_03905, partial [Roseiflexaceae bacterium]|nr:hypothetical protein [Roseiflexaceae bacterium]
LARGGTTTNSEHAANAMAPDAPAAVAQSHLVWRVRILSLTETEILVEQPSTLGQIIEIDRGMNMVVILSIGQNRWMFNASCLGCLNVPSADRRGATSGLRLSMPESVQRCQRRNHYRLDTPLNLPQVDMWPLLDPRSVVPAERAHEIQFEIDMGRMAGQLDSLRMDFESVMPEVGPKISGSLLNLGGGGMGLRVGPQDATILNRYKLFWLRFNLPPALKTPICASAKLVHTHMESTHDTYAGMAFDFSFNPSHQKFVVDQICRFIAMQQREQTAHRRTA